MDHQAVSILSLAHHALYQDHLDQVCKDKRSATHHIGRLNHSAASKTTSHWDQIVHFSASRSRYTAVYSSDAKKIVLGGKLNSNIIVGYNESIGCLDRVSSVSCGDVYAMYLETITGAARITTLDRGSRYLPSAPTRSIVQISSGTDHCGMVSRDGHVYTLGCGQYGRLGHGTDKQMCSPTPIQALKDVRVAKISCGHFHSAVVTRDGHLYTFGRNSRKQLGYMHLDKKSPMDYYDGYNALDIPESRFALDFGPFFNNPRFSDITLTTSDGNAIHIHAIVLYHHSLVNLNKILTELLASTTARPVVIDMHDFLGRLGNGDAKDITYTDMLQVIQPFYTDKMAVPMVYSLASKILGITRGTFPRRQPSQLVAKPTMLSSFYNNPMFSDVVLDHPTAPIHAHRVVLAARSPYYNALFSFDNQTVNVPDGPGGNIVIQYLYEDRYQITDNTQGDELLSVIKLANIHGIQRLHVAAQAIVAQSVDASNASDLTAFAEIHNADGLLSHIKYLGIESQVEGAHSGNQYLSAGQYIPRRVIINKTIVDVSAGHKLTLVLTSEEKAIQIGRFGLMNPNAIFHDIPVDRVQKISAGHGHAAVLTDDHKVYSWGRADYGQVNGNCSSFQKNPIQVCPDKLFNNVTCGRHSTHLWYSAVDLTDADGNIKLLSKAMSIYSDQLKELATPVLFRENDIAIKTDMSAIARNNRAKNEIIIQIKYQDLTKFVVSFFKDNTSILISAKEFSFEKSWLKAPKFFTNHELGVPNDIWLKGIKKNDFKDVKALLIKKSPHLSILLQTEYIKDHYVEDQDRERFYFFNTFFYNSLTKKSSDEAYKKIAKWTRDVDIFSKDFLFIPINENFHWTLCIISFPGQDAESSTALNKPLIMYLDSLNAALGSVTSKIRTYLQMEWKHKKSDRSNGVIPERVFNAANLPVVRSNVPKQDNLCDCALGSERFIGTIFRRQSNMTEFERPSQKRLMAKWTKMLDHVVDQFIETAAQRPNIGWWNRICMDLGGESGIYQYSGWITVFAVF
eukprot:gene5694-6578_t